MERKTRAAFRGYAALRRLLDFLPPETPDLSADEHKLAAELRALLAQTKRKLVWFRISPLPLLFSLLPLWLLAVLLPAAHATAVLLLPQFGILTFTWQQAGVSLAGSLGGAFILHLLGRLMAGRPARVLAATIGGAQGLVDACQKTAEAHYRQESDRIRDEAETRTEQLNQRWSRAVEEAAE